MCDHYNVKLSNSSQYKVKLLRLGGVQVEICQFCPHQVGETVKPSLELRKGKSDSLQ